MIKVFVNIVWDIFLVILSLFLKLHTFLSFSSENSKYKHAILRKKKSKLYHTIWTFQTQACFHNRIKKIKNANATFFPYNCKFTVYLIILKLYYINSENCEIER